MTTFYSATAVVAAALLSTSLAACSLIGSKDAKDQESASAQSTDSMGGDTGTQGAQATAMTGQPAPAGYQMVTAPTSKFSFAVPDGWQLLSSDDLQDDQKVEAAAAVLGKSADEVRQMFSSVELEAISATPDDKGFAENANVSPAPAEITSLPSEALMNQAIQAQGGTPSEYSTAPTALGEAAVQTYTLNVQTVMVQGALIVAPTKDGGWTTISVSASDAARTKELTDTITSTLS